MVIINIQSIKIGDPKSYQAMLELNSAVENLMRDSPAHPDGILAGLEIKNGHDVAVKNAVFSAFQLDGDGGVFAVLNRKPELEAADIAFTSMA